MILIGYSGHAFVVCGILHAAGKKVTGYCEKTQKDYNPFSLEYLGDEVAAIESLRKHPFFIAIGDNAIREKIFHALVSKNCLPINAIHPSAVVDASAVIAANAVMIAANATINPLVQIGTGVICNTNCSIDHECIIEPFAHIAPGAILCGNVRVGSQSFIGANAVIKQGIKIGKNVMVGAGAVVVHDVPDNCTVMGVPAK